MSIRLNYISFCHILSIQMFERRATTERPMALSKMWPAPGTAGGKCQCSTSSPSTQLDSTRVFSLCFDSVLTQLLLPQLSHIPCFTACVLFIVISTFHSSVCLACSKGKSVSVSRRCKMHSRKHKAHQHHAWLHGGGILG